MPPKHRNTPGPAATSPDQVEEEFPKEATKDPAIKILMEAINSLCLFCVLKTELSDLIGLNNFPMTSEVNLIPLKKKPPQQFHLLRPQSTNMITS